jgi:hypothetical protein
MGKSAAVSKLWSRRDGDTARQPIDVRQNAEDILIKTANLTVPEQEEI